MSALKGTFEDAGQVAKDVLTSETQTIGQQVDKQIAGFEQMLDTYDIVIRISRERKAGA